MSLKEEVLDVLHPTVWKRVLQIIKDVAENRSVAKRLVKEPSIGAIYATLHNFIDQGLVLRRRAVLTIEELRLRGDRVASEYRLSEEGFRRKMEKPENEIESGYNDSLVPAT